MNRFEVCLLTVMVSVLISGCQVVTNLLPTQTPYPTHTPYPTLTPYPTFTPIPSPTSTPEKKVIYQENDFSGVDSCFSIGSDPDVQRSAEDGQFHIAVQTPNFYGWTLCDKDLRNFIMDVDATVIEGPNSNVYAYGVLFRYDNASQGFYAFLISGDGYYALDAIYPSDFFSLLAWSSIREIGLGKKTNHLRVHAMGDQIELYVNGAHVGLIREGTLRSGPLGFIVQTYDETGVRVAFDNLVITEP